MEVKPSWTLIIISTIKMIFVLGIFYCIAIFTSSSKYYTAINLLKIILPLIVIIYTYVFLFWNSVSIELQKNKLDFRMKVGRKNHIELFYNDIESISIKETFLEKLFGVATMEFVIKNMENEYGGNLMVLRQYMVFKKDLCHEIAAYIKD
ncbi:MAG: hypothetical protein ACRCW1_05055 [Anaerotignaceae bacterium]